MDYITKEGVHLNMENHIVVPEINKAWKIGFDYVKKYPEGYVFLEEDSIYCFPEKRFTLEDDRIKCYEYTTKWTKVE